MQYTKMNQLNKNQEYFDYVGLFKKNQDLAVKKFFNSNEFKSLQMTPYEFMVDYNVIENLENISLALLNFNKYKSNFPDFLSNLFFSILFETLGNDNLFSKKVSFQLKKYSELTVPPSPSFSKKQFIHEDLINSLLNKKMTNIPVTHSSARQVNNNNNDLSEIEKMIDNKLKLFKEEINSNINNKFEQLFFKINELYSKNHIDDSKKNTNKDGYVDTLFKIIDKVSSNDTIVKMLDNSCKKEEEKKPDFKNTFDTVSTIFNTFKSVNDFGKYNTNTEQKSSLVEDYTSKILDSCKKNIVENNQNETKMNPVETLSSLLNSFNTTSESPKKTNENISPAVNTLLDFISKLTGNGIDIDIKFDDKKSDDLIDLSNVITKNEPMVPPSSPLFEENVDDLNIIYDN
jgi:hypothetical protein